MNFPTTTLSATLFFLGEVAAYVGFVVWSRSMIDGPGGWVAGIGIVVVVGTLWLRHLAPKSKRPLPPLWRIYARELVLFAGAAAWYVTGPAYVAGGLVAVATVGATVEFIRLSSPPRPKDRVE